MSVLFDSTHRVRGSLSFRPHPTIVRGLSWIDLAHGWSHRATAPKHGAVWWVSCVLSVLAAVGGLLLEGRAATGLSIVPSFHGPVLLAIGTAGLLSAGALWTLRLARHGAHLLRQDATRALALLMGHLEAVLSARDHAAGFVRAFPVTQEGFAVGYPVHKDMLEEDLLRLWFLPAILDATTPHKRPVLPFFQDEWEDQIEDSSGNRYSAPKERLLFGAKTDVPRTAHQRLAALIALKGLVPPRAQDDFDRWRAHFVARLRQDKAA